MPPGTLISFAGGVAPLGWLPCDGRALDGDDPLYAGLFQALGTTWGDGSTGAGATSGVTDFNLPDMRGRALIGSGTYDDPVGGLTTRSLGERMGARLHVLTVAELPAHSHSYGDYYYYDQLTGSPDYQTPDGDGTGTRVEAGRTTASTGGNAPHNTMPPSAVVQHLIKL